MHHLLSSYQRLSIDIFMALPIKDWYHVNKEEETARDNIPRYVSFFQKGGNDTWFQ
jgi:hypothetical protein